MTVLQTLVNEQLIYRCQGLGSFVQDGRSYQSFIHLSDFVEDMKWVGMDVSSEVVRMKPASVPEQISSTVEVDSDATAVRFRSAVVGRRSTHCVNFYPYFIRKLNSPS
ncbi:MAG: hypothetical protein U5K69_14400 [Balneolaceae bacterium]|nr:hypothetical protein [Balneolaceae bacterium]